MEVLGIEPRSIELFELVSPSAGTMFVTRRERGALFLAGLSGYLNPGSRKPMGASRLQHPYRRGEKPLGDGLPLYLSSLRHMVVGTC